MVAKEKVLKRKGDGENRMVQKGSWIGVHHNISLCVDGGGAGGGGWNG